MTAIKEAMHTKKKPAHSAAAVQIFFEPGVFIAQSIAEKRVYETDGMFNIVN